MKGTMYLKRYRLIKIALVPGVLALALIGAGCGGDDNKKDGGGELSLSVDADRFAGPTPLKVNFSAKPKNTTGEVHYRWRFDDGTQSEDPSPSHAFPRAGYYTVIVDVRDESGNNTRQSLLLGAWPPRQWALAQTKPLTKKGALATQKVQQARTDARHKDLRDQLRKKLNAGS
jgi:PKD domain-containing protein